MAANMMASGAVLGQGRSECILMSGYTEIHSEPIS